MLGFPPFLDLLAQPLSGSDATQLESTPQPRNDSNPITSLDLNSTQCGHTQMPKHPYPGRALSTSVTPTTSPEFNSTISEETFVPKKEKRKYTARNNSSSNGGSGLEVEKPRQYKCTFEGCGLEFLSSGHLIRHSRIHTQERPYKCSLPLCDLTFSRSDTAIKHSRCHIKKLQIAGHEIPTELLSPKKTLAPPCLGEMQSSSRQRQRRKLDCSEPPIISKSCPPLSHMTTMMGPYGIIFWKHVDIHELMAHLTSLPANSYPSACNLPGQLDARFNLPLSSFELNDPSLPFFMDLQSSNEAAIQNQFSQLFNLNTDSFLKPLD
ncbi:hypothetical protein BDR26DRAFT_861180 [Obelidium mucronatum]|nr:hypothetical protein BDR26DRAFT_861180 [Obelidium mucronatum]